MLSRYFKREEISCKCGCGFDTIDADLLAVLDGARVYFDAPIYITSSARCGSHNTKVGGEEDSQHLVGKAVDIVVKGVTPETVQDYFLNKYPNSKGIGSYREFTHIDVRDGKARW